MSYIGHLGSNLIRITNAPCDQGHQWPESQGGVGFSDRTEIGCIETPRTLQLVLAIGDCGSTRRTRRGDRRSRERGSRASGEKLSAGRWPGQRPRSPMEVAPSVPSACGSVTALGKALDRCCCCHSPLSGEGGGGKNTGWGWGAKIG